MPPAWNRDCLWSKQDARARRHRSLAVMAIVFSLGIGLGVANHACYQLVQHVDRPAAEFVRTIPVPSHGAR